MCPLARFDMTFLAVAVFRAFVTFVNKILCAVTVLVAYCSSLLHQMVDTVNVTYDKRYYMIYIMIKVWRPVKVNEHTCTYIHRSFLNTIQYNTMENLHSKTDKHTVSLI